MRQGKTEKYSFNVSYGPNKAGHVVRMNHGINITVKFKTFIFDKA